MSEQQPLLVTPAQAAAISRTVRRVENLRGDGVRKSDDAIEIVQSLPKVRIPPAAQSGGGALTILKITGFASPASLGNGWYWALVQKRNATAFTATSTLTLSTYYTNVGDATAYVVLQSIIENGSATHDLTANSFIPAWSLEETVTVSGTDYDVYQTSFVALSC
jgi:hypothetical protein